jgi:hypothetical protein
MTADKGTIFGGDTYSDYLAPSQIDYYTVSLIVGVTYTVDVSSASTELVYSLVGPQSFVATSGYVNAGQQIAYTPTVSGDYLFGLETANGMAGSYTFTAGSSQVPGPSQRPDTSGTTSSPSSTTLAVSQAAGNANPPPLSRTFTVQDATTG